MHIQKKIFTHPLRIIFPYWDVGSVMVEQWKIERNESQRLVRCVLLIQMQLKHRLISKSIRLTIAKGAHSNHSHAFHCACLSVRTFVRCLSNVLSVYVCAMHINQSFGISLSHTYCEKCLEASIYFFVVLPYWISQFEHHHKPLINKYYPSVAIDFNRQRFRFTFK